MSALRICYKGPKCSQPLREDDRGWAHARLSNTKILVHRLQPIHTCAILQTQVHVYYTTSQTPVMRRSYTLLQHASQRHGTCCRCCMHQHVRQQSGCWNAPFLTLHEPRPLSATQPQSKKATQHAIIPYVLLLRTRFWKAALALAGSSMTANTPWTQETAQSDHHTAANPRSALLPALIGSLRCIPLASVLLSTSARSCSSAMWSHSPGPGHCILRVHITSPYHHTKRPVNLHVSGPQPKRLSVSVSDTLPAVPKAPTGQPTAMGWLAASSPLAATDNTHPAFHQSACNIARLGGHAPCT